MTCILYTQVLFLWRCTQSDYPISPSFFVNEVFDLNLLRNGFYQISLEIFYNTLGNVQFFSSPLGIPVGEVPWQVTGALGNVLSLRKSSNFSNIFTSVTTPRKLRFLRPVRKLQSWRSLQKGGIFYSLIKCRPRYVSIAISTRLLEMLTVVALDIDLESFCSTGFII